MNSRHESSITDLPKRYQPYYPTALLEHFRKLPNGKTEFRPDQIWCASLQRWFKV